MSLLNRRSKAERFEAAVMQHERGIYLLCLRMMGRREDAEACAQEALLNAYRSYDSFRGEADIKTWLYRIASNTCMSALRKRRGDSSLEVLREEGFEPTDTRMPQPEREAERNDLRTRLSEAIAALPDDQREIVVLREYQDLPYDQIASILEISEGTVKSRLNRAREKLKKYLTDVEQIGGKRVQGNEGRQG